METRAKYIEWKQEPFCKTKVNAAGISWHEITVKKAFIFHRIRNCTQILLQD